MQKPNNANTKPRYRFRQSVKSNLVVCINGVWPPMPEPPQNKAKGHIGQSYYLTVQFPTRPGSCPKCKSKGVIHPQLTGKLLGICFWCDGKGNINDADIMNAQRRVQSGLGIDNKSTN